MPSLISGYEYDIFISYRHKDNKSDGWVTEFVRTLRSELEATFKEDISIYFDENPHDGLLQHHEVDDSLKEKLRCLILIPIVSQTYCDPKAFAWQHELLAFIKLASEDKLGLKTKVGGGNTASRVLPVRIHEVDASDKKLFEEATGGIMRPIDFIYKESGVNRPLRVNEENPGKNQNQIFYRNQVNKVANAIKDIISGLQGTEANASPGESPEVTKDRVPPLRERVVRRRMIRFPKITTLFGFATAAFMAFIALAIIHFSEPAPEQVTYQAAILPPEKATFSAAAGGHIALSPDGRSLAFTAVDSTGRTRLWVRRLESLEAQSLHGTEEASFPFWSPDSRYIGFFAGGKLKRIESTGGPPLNLGDAGAGRGGTWSGNGVIVFNPSGGGFALCRVPASGGTPVVFTKLDSSRYQYSHRWPHFLPDGEHFLFSTRTTAGAAGEGDAIFLGSLDTTFTPRLLAYSGSSAEYANGHILYTREQTLMAHPFDLGSMETTGDPIPIANRVHFESLTGKSTFTVSRNGILAYQTGTSSGGVRLFWHDRAGKQIGAIIESSFYHDIRISPDGKRVVIAQIDTRIRNTDLWVYETGRAVWTRFTFDPTTERWPIWSPDGMTIAFSSQKKGVHHLFQRAASGAGSEEVLLQSNQSKSPTDWSRDGKFLAYSSIDPKRRNDIWILPMNQEGVRKPLLFLQTDFNEERAVFSPDGRWIAYDSDESGKFEVYVRPFPGPGGKWQVSTAGGSHARWRRDGKELFYLSNDDEIMSTEITLGSSTVDIGSVKPLFHFRPFHGGGRQVYDVMGDGQRFMVVSLGSLEISPPLTLVVNWPGEIKK